MGLEELDFGELPSSIEEAFPAFVRIVTDDYKKHPQHKVYPYLLRGLTTNTTERNA